MRKKWKKSRFLQVIHFPFCGIGLCDGIVYLLDNMLVQERSRLNANDVMSSGIWDALWYCILSVTMEMTQVTSLSWTVLSAEGVLTLLQLTCRLFAKVNRRMFPGFVSKIRFCKVYLTDCVNSNYILVSCGMCWQFGKLFQQDHSRPYSVAIQGIFIDAQEEVQCREKITLSHVTLIQCYVRRKLQR